MPWHVEKRGNGPKPFKVVKDDTGEVVGMHSSRMKAQEQVKALYANTKDEDYESDKPAPSTEGKGMVKDSAG